MNDMWYKGFAARVEYDAKDRIFVGHVAGIRNVVGFHGESVDALEAAFHEAVNDYLGLLAYKKERRAQSHRALDELARQAQEEDMGY